MALSRHNELIKFSPNTVRTMAEGWHRPTKIIIDTQAIKENVYNQVKRLSKGTELFAVVKANGYGHGAVETAIAARNGGATGFCVAILDEAIELRHAGITEPILILSVVDANYIDLLLKYDLTVTVATFEWLEQAIEQFTRIGTKTPLKIHIKVDTGMGRIGFTTPEDTKKAVKLVQATKRFAWEGLFTHFSTADHEDVRFFKEQERRFLEISSALSELPRYVHSNNSAAAFWHPGTLGNMIRFGVAMYGLNPSGNTLNEPYPLKPALSLVSSLIHVKEHPKGETLGYGRTYVAIKNEWIGTIPIGYADGWLRHLQGFSVLVEGVKCEIVGRICMDQCMVRLPKEMALGTRVTLIGSDHGETITMQMVADKLATINYEVACTFSKRIPRVYTDVTGFPEPKVESEFLKIYRNRNRIRRRSDMCFNLLRTI